MLSFDVNNFESCEKRFACVKFLLDEMVKTEFSYKQSYDMITRLSQELGTFNSNQLVEITEYCIDCIRAGDPKCIG